MNLKLKFMGIVVLLVFILLIFLSECKKETVGRNIIKGPDEYHEGRIDKEEYYSSNSLLIKFKDNNFNFNDEGFTKRIKNVKEIEFSPSLNVLNNKYNAKTIKKIVRDDSNLNSLVGLRLITFENVENLNIKSAKIDYENDPNVDHIEFNVVYYLQNIDDPLYDKMWNLNNIEQEYYGFYEPIPGNYDSDIDFPESLNLSLEGEDILIAVIDTGIDYNHEELLGEVWKNVDEIPNNQIDDDNNSYVDDFFGYDFYNSDSDPMDDYGHGTHVAGTIAAKQNNKGISGICNKCKVMAVKGYFTMYQSEVMEIFLYLVENGVKVTSNSYGCKYHENNPDCNSTFYQDVINEMHDVFGMIHVAAAGNDGNAPPPFSQVYNYPASFDNVISVAATNNEDLKADFSTYNDMVDISAPGVDIYSLRANDTDLNGNLGDPFTHIINELGQQDDNGKYYILSGTSMATPHVAGAVGLIWSKFPNLNNTEIEVILLSSIDDIYEINPGYEDMLGSGRLNLNFLCLDGTFSGQCLSNKPTFCSAGQLINNCQKCGCPSTKKFCLDNGFCSTNNIQIMN